MLVVIEKNYASKDRKDKDKRRHHCEHDISRVCWLRSGERDCTITAKPRCEDAHEHAESDKSEDYQTSSRGSRRLSAIDEGNSSDQCRHGQHCRYHRDDNVAIAKETAGHLTVACN